jgi:very-short-patch-repair endonuclease
VPQQTLITSRARRLRKSMTQPEVMLWSRLRVRRPDRPIFRRQHPMGSMILDFYCAAARLGVEVDGATHWGDEARDRDEARDIWLRRHGVTVLRIPASAIYRNVGAVADGILLVADELLLRSAEAAAFPHHRPLCGGRSPSPATRGGGNDLP